MFLLLSNYEELKFCESNKAKISYELHISVTEGKLLLREHQRNSVDLEILQLAAKGGHRFLFTPLR